MSRKILIPLLASVCALWAAASAAPRAAVDQDAMIGEIAIATVGEGDTLLDVARRHGLGFVEVVAVNPGVDPWVPEEGADIVLPARHILPRAPREGIVVNLPEMRIYYFPPDGGPVETYPVGIGREGKSTPLGTTRVAGKRKNPAWYPTEETRKDNPDLPRVVPAGPDNPLGDHALELGWPTYLIHGTNNVWGIGRRVSRGCIRMYPEHIEALFERVGTGTPINVVDQPVKFAWHDGKLYMEAHTTQKQAEELEATGSFSPDPDLDLARLVGQALQGRLVPLNWARIERTAAERRGIPVRVSQ